MAFALAALTGGVAGPNTVSVGSAWPRFGAGARRQDLFQVFQDAAFGFLGGFGALHKVADLIRRNGPAPEHQAGPPEVFLAGGFEFVVEQVQRMQHADGELRMVSCGWGISSAISIQPWGWVRSAQLPNLSR